MPANGRLKELDALRGLAALTVVLGHFGGLFIYVFPNYHHTKSLLLYLIVQLVGNGHAAVILFFLLSGFVLSIPSIHGRPQSYPVFLTRRITRIYLPYLAGLFLAVLGSYFLHRHVALAQGDWWRPVQWPLVWQHVLFVGSYEWGVFNPAFWSLVVEMRVSLAFPLLCMFVLRMPWRLSLLLSWVAASGMALLGTFLPHAAVAPPAFYFTLHLGDICGTIYYANLFIVGILLARHRERLTQWASGLTTGASCAMFIGSMLLYIYGNLAVACFCRVAFRGMTVLPSIVNDCSGEWPCAIGATGLILLALGRKSFSNAMLSSGCQFLGKISYSLYLLHLTILAALLHLVYGKIPTPLLFPIYLVCVVAGSTIFYKYIEEPSMEIGRKIGDRLKLSGAANRSSHGSTQQFQPLAEPVRGEE
jgi:peptidoglycan/LPS O-acetylase OafA/YrhL